jgi:type I restriction enzyme S subunit
VSFCEDDLPDGWRLANLGELAAVTGGLTRNATKRDSSQTRAPLVSVAAVQLRHINVGAVAEVGLLESDGDRAILEPGDLLVVEGNGSLDHIGRVALWNNEVPGARHQNHIIRVRPHSLPSRYVLEWLASPAGREAIVHEATSAAGLYTLSLSKVERIPVPVPPAGQEHRIVEKLNALQFRSRRAKESLDAIPPLLERFRQSVLAAAFRGDLTAEWRAENPDVEPASELLKRIRAERRHRWEESELAKMKAKGKPPTDDRWKGKYEEPAGVEAKGLPVLPHGWAWASVGEVLVALRNGIGTKPENKTGLRILRISAVRPMAVNHQDVRYLPNSEEYQDYLLRNGDLLLTRYNGNPGLVGVAGLVRDLTQPTVYPDKLIRAIPLDSVVSAAFLELALNTGITRNHIATHGKSAAGQVGVSGEDIRSAPVAIPPIEEQRELATRVRKLIASMDVVLRVNTSLFDQVNALNRAILAKAFRGDLVPQDPADEPASSLLARLAAERDTPAPSTPAAPPRRPKRSPPRTKA